MPEPDSSSKVPFGEALAIAVRGLRGQPPLLLAVAVAIVLAAVAVVAGETERLLALALVALVALGLVAWLIADARRVRKSAGGVSQRVSAGFGARQKNITLSAAGASSQEVVAAPRAQQEDVSLRSGREAATRED